MLKVSDILHSEAQWLQGTWATKPIITSKGVDTEIALSEDKSATCFCLLGAIRHCYAHVMEGSKYGDVIKQVKDELRIGTWVSIIEWNDDKKRTFEEVKALIDKLDI